MEKTYCKHLRTKSMYTGSTPEEVLAEAEGHEIAGRHFWCNRTQTVIGVDQQAVNKNTCNPSRSCCEQ